MAYCTIGEAQAQGATGTDAEIESAIAEATERIDRFTAERFEPTELTVSAAFGAGGVAPLPRRVQSVDAVRFVGAGADIDPGAYRVRQSETPGDIDAIEFAGYGHGGYNDLIAGAEQYNGGYSNLARPGRRVQVTGTFGYDAVPATVARVTARLAARITQVGATTPGDIEVPAGVQSLSVEGYSVTFTDASAGSSATTGFADIDRELRAYQRKVLVG